METNNLWFDFGFAGAVTGTLLTVTFFVVKWALSFASKLQDTHKIEREEWRQEARQVRGEHTAERVEWRSAFQRIADAHEAKLDSVCETLNRNIHDIARRDINND